jgi:hypothetical protein
MAYLGVVAVGGDQLFPLAATPATVPTAPQAQQPLGLRLHVAPVAGDHVTPDERRPQRSQLVTQLGRLEDQGRGPLGFAGGNDGAMTLVEVAGAAGWFVLFATIGMLMGWSALRDWREGRRKGDSVILFSAVQQFWPALASVVVAFIPLVVVLRE